MNKNTSKLIKAMSGWTEALKTYSKPPDGVFGRKAIIQSGNVTLNADELDIEFEIPFDDDTEANEAEIIVYNLSKTSIEALKYNNPITITAGYKNDTGVIFSGFIASIRTKWEGVDKITTIKALDDTDLKERDIVETTYKAGTTASYILKDLIGMLHLPLAVFSVRRDWTYKDEQKVSGGIMENIRKYANVCGISVYINQSKIYARHVSEGDNINFTVCADTGLIESPEEFEEEVTAEDYKDVVKGYKFKMLLQHRMTTAAITDLKSRDILGTFRVRKGKHIFNGSETITEVEVLGSVTTTIVQNTTKKSSSYGSGGSGGGGDSYTGGGSNPTKLQHIGKLKEPLILGSDTYVQMSTKIVNGVSYYYNNGKYYPLSNKYKTKIDGGRSEANALPTNTSIYRAQ